MQTSKPQKEVRYSLPAPVMERFKMAAEVSGIPVDEFIKRYTLKCMEVNISAKRPVHPTPTPDPKKAA